MLCLQPCLSIYNSQQLPDFVQISLFLKISLKKGAVDHMDVPLLNLLNEAGIYSMYLKRPDDDTN